MKNVLFIIGVSGSGKSYLAKQLQEKFPNEYYKMRQYTTREKRVNETLEDYYFISKEHYNIISHCLMANTVVNNNYYGTIPVFKEDKIACLVVNCMGIIDGINYCINKDININYRILYVDSIEPFEKRKDRDESFVNNERKEIEEVLGNIPNNKIIRIEHNKGNMINIDDLKDIIKDSFKN